MCQWEYLSCNPWRGTRSSTVSKALKNFSIRHRAKHEGIRTQLILFHITQRLTSRSRIITRRKFTTEDRIPGLHSDARKSLAQFVVEWASICVLNQSNVESSLSTYTRRSFRNSSWAFQVILSLETCWQNDIIRGQPIIFAAFMTCRLRGIARSYLDRWPIPVRSLYWEVMPNRCVGSHPRETWEGLRRD